jgi:hypothetical protein
MRAKRAAARVLRTLRSTAAPGGGRVQRFNVTADGIRHAQRHAGAGLMSDARQS